MLLLLCRVLAVLTRALRPAGLAFVTGWLLGHDRDGCATGFLAGLGVRALGGAGEWAWRDEPDDECGGDGGPGYGTAQPTRCGQSTRMGARPRPLTTWASSRLARFARFRARTRLRGVVRR